MMCSEREVQMKLPRRQFCISLDGRFRLIRTLSRDECKAEFDPHRT